MSKPVSNSTLRQAVRALSTTGTVSKAAVKLGIPRTTLQTRIGIAAKRGLTKGVNLPVQSKTKWEVEDNEDKGTKTIWSIDSRVHTVADAIKKGEIDLNIWEVSRSIVNSWEVGMKLGRTDIKVQPLWQVKLWLNRKVPKIYTDASDSLIKRMSKHAPKYPKITRTKNNDPHMLEVSVFDLHFGKLAWERETGTNYDMKIAERMYRESIKGLVDRVKSFSIEKVLFPIGQDFFHIDNPTKTTVNGTVQDVDVRYTKLFETGTMACVNAIDYLRNVADVKVLYVPGNHDRTAAWHMAAFLSAWYRNDSHVQIDTAPTTRKYEQYGINLIGFTHGDEEPHRDLPTIMASEVPQKWADAKCREWHLGHFHKKKETRHVTGDSFGPVHVRVLPSLSGTDAWHYRKGYTQGMRAAEAYLWSRKEGYVGHFNVYAKEE